MELGYDLRAVCRELSRMVRDLLVLSVDPSRIADPEISGEGERDRLLGLAARFSREDLLRAFDLLARAEQEIRAAAQPRYNFEMALLRWIHLRKLIPIEDLIAGNPTPAVSAARPGPAVATKPATPVAKPPAAAHRESAAAPAAKVPSTEAPGPDAVVASGSSRTFKDSFLAEIRKAKAVFYNMVVAQAQKIDVSADRIVFTFSPNQRTLRDQVEQNKAWLETVAQQIGGRRFTVAALQDGTPSSEPRAASRGPEQSRGTEPRTESPESDRKAALKQQALADSGVQAMLEVFPAEIRDVEEM